MEHKELRLYLIANLIEWPTMGQVNKKESLVPSLLTGYEWRTDLVYGAYIRSTTSSFVLLDNHFESMVEHYRGKDWSFLRDMEGALKVRQVKESTVLSQEESPAKGCGGLFLQDKYVGKISGDTKTIVEFIFQSCRSEPRIRFLITSGKYVGEYCTTTFRSFKDNHRKVEVQHGS